MLLASTAGPKFVHYAVKDIHFLLLVVTFPNAEMTLGLEANEVEAKVLTSLASVTGSTGFADIGLTESNVREPGS